VETFTLVHESDGRGGNEVKGGRGRGMSYDRATTDDHELKISF
jgi:hypothetical protein